MGRSAEFGADGVFIHCLDCSSPSGSILFTSFQGLYRNEAPLPGATAGSSSSVPSAPCPAPRPLKHCEQQSVFACRACSCPWAWRGAPAGPGRSAVARWAGNASGLARSGWRVGAAPSVVEPWCDSKALLTKSFWNGIHGKALENLCLQHKLLSQPPALP